MALAAVLRTYAPSRRLVVVTTYGSSRWVNAVEGGLPSADELHRRLLADWLYAEHTQATDQAVQAIIDRYRFEERR